MFVGACSDVLCSSACWGSWQGCALSVLCSIVKSALADRVRVCQLRRWPHAKPFHPNYLAALLVPRKCYCNTALLKEWRGKKQERDRKRASQALHGFACDLGTFELQVTPAGFILS